MKRTKDVDVYFTPIESEECKVSILSPVCDPGSTPAHKLKKKRRARDGSFAGSSKKAPFARGGSTLTAVGSKLYLIGGASPDGVCREGVEVYDLEEGRWSVPKEVGGEAPPGMQGHSAVAFRDSIYVFGGMKVATNDFELFDDVYVLDTRTFIWTKARTAGPKPSPRNSHTANIVNVDKALKLPTEDAADTVVSVDPGDTLMVVIGGSCPLQGPKGDVYALKLNSEAGVLRWAKLKVSFSFCTRLSCLNMLCIS